MKSSQSTKLAKDVKVGDTVNRPTGEGYKFAVVVQVTVNPYFGWIGFTFGVGQGGWFWLNPDDEVVVCNHWFEWKNGEDARGACRDCGITALEFGKWN